MKVQVHYRHEGQLIAKRIEPQDYDKWTLKDLIENDVAFQFDSAEQMRDELTDIIKENNMDDLNRAQLNCERNGMQSMYDLLSATKNWK